MFKNTIEDAKSAICLGQFVGDESVQVREAIQQITQHLYFIHKALMKSRVPTDELSTGYLAAKLGITGQMRSQPAFSNDKHPRISIEQIEEYLGVRR